ncbi:MFS general substrate transporter [Coniochaeta sp. PMI_546]|nr:MFS general substrate transporter [Coniochaeta sp. PMI_546]
MTLKKQSDPGSPDSGSEPLEEQDYSVFSDAVRIYLTYFLGVVIILSTLTATIYFPLIPMLSSKLSVSIQAINLTVSVYAIFQAVTPTTFASLADTYGRRPILMSLVGLYACASLGLSLNKNSYTALVILRALQSIGGSATPPIAYGIVADVAVASQRGRMLGPLLATCNGISAVGPVIGGAVALSTSGVTWVFFALFIVAVACFVLIGFTLPETARNVVGNGSKLPTGMQRTWWSLISSTKGHSNSRNQSRDDVSDQCGVDPRPPVHIVRTLGASFRIILYPDAAAVLWMVATSYSVYYTYQVAIPVIFADIYHYNELQIGLTFLPGLAGMTLGGIVAGKIADRNYSITAKKHNIALDHKKGENLVDFPLEEARYRCCLPFVFLEILLVIAYGWVVHLQVHPSVPIIIQFFICGLSTMLSHTASALLVDIFPDQSSSAYAAGQVMRCGLSAASAAAIQPLVDAVGRGWCFTMFAIFVGVSGLSSVAVSRTKGMGWRQERLAAKHSDGPVPLTPL